MGATRRRGTLFGLLQAWLLAVASPVGAQEFAWYDCTAWGSSHTGRYTFRIGTGPCSVYWKEIDRTLDVKECAPPRIVAVKPFAVANGYELAFDLLTGSFEDFTPAWSDRGRCIPLPDDARRR